MDDTETFAVAGLVAPHPLAAAAGRDVLIEGGNVIEAAIAAAAVSAVVVPHRNGIGGDALWMIREPGPRGRVRVLDARGKVGQGATAAYARRHDAVPPHGPGAVATVPGAAAGWGAAHDLSTALGGRLPLRRLLAPAHAAARDGFVLASEAAILAAGAEGVAHQPGFGDAFLPDGRVAAAGARLRQPRLAATLDYLIANGLDDLYRGDVARELAADLEEASSPLGRADLRDADARWRAPATLDLGRRSLDVVPGRAGLTMATAAGLFTALRDMRPDGFDHWHGLIESVGRAEHLLASETDLSDLLDPDRLARESLRLDRTRAGPTAPWVSPANDEEAVFVGAMGHDGSAVALVQSLGGIFGSGMVSGRTGILLGNRAAALALDPRSGPVLAPGRRVPMASVPCLIGLGDGRVVSLGATGQGGGTGAVQVVVRLLMGAAAADALAAPRFGLGALPGESAAAVLLGEDVDGGVAARLRSAGHLVAEVPRRHRRAALVARRADARIEAWMDGDEAGIGAGL